MAIATRCTVSGRDVAGDPARTSFYAADATTALALADAINAASNARLTQVTGYARQPLTTIKGAPVDADYPLGQDKAVLIFQATADLSIHKFNVPAPIAGLFDADGKEVVNTGAGATLITAYQDNATTALESATLVFVRGHRSFRKSRKF